MRFLAEANANVDWNDASRDKAQPKELETFSDAFMSYLRFDLSKITGTSCVLFSVSDFPLAKLDFGIRL